MGLFSSVKKAVQKPFQSAGGAISKAGRQFTQNARNSGSAFAAIGTYGAAPITIAASSLTTSLQAARPALSEATGILRENPELLGAAGAALGMPGLGGLFGGGGGAAGYDMPPGGTFSQPSGIPPWVWIAAALAAVVGVILYVRKS